MFKKILLFLIIFIPYLFAQRTVDGGMLWWASSKGYVNSWTPANLPIDTTSTSVYFYGEAPKAKVAKDSGGVSVRPYMRVWTDSIAIVNSTFNANINGWHGWVGNDSLKWVASGGGFTGAIMAFTLGGFVSFMTDTMSLLAGSYHLAADLFYEADVSDTYFYGLLRLNDTSFAYFEQGVGGRTGTIIIDEVVEITAGNYVLTFFTSSADTMRMYGDNITLTNTADSTYGYTYTIPRPSDTTTYYYSQSVWWRQKDKDTIWLAAETDTVTVYPYIPPPHTYLVNQDGGKILIKGGTYAIKFKD